jgi:hypothetical protein
MIKLNFIIDIRKLPKPTEEILFIYAPLQSPFLPWMRSRSAWHAKEIRRLVSAFFAQAELNRLMREMGLKGVFGWIADEKRSVR